MFFLASRGYRCIAHDRRGHGRSSQPWNGNDLDTYADDLAELVDAARPEGRHPCRPFHRRRRGRALHRPPRHQARRQGGADRRDPAADAEDAGQSRRHCRSRSSTSSAPASLADRSQFLKDLSLPFYGYNRPGAKVSEGVRDSFWLQGMMAGFPASLLLHQGVLRDRPDRGPEEVRRADADPARRRRPDRADRRLGACSRPSSSRTRRSRSTRAPRTACARRTRTRSTRTCSRSSRHDPHALAETLARPVIQPAVHAFMAKRADARKASEIKGASHVVMISHPTRPVRQCTVSGVQELLVSTRPQRHMPRLRSHAIDYCPRTSGDRHDRGTPALSALHRRDRDGEGAHGRRRLEHTRPRAGRAGLHGRQRLAEPCRVPARPRGHRGVPRPQVATRARLPPDQGAVGVPRQPHRRALRLRVARRQRQLVPQLRQRELGVRRATG